MLETEKTSDIAGQPCTIGGGCMDKKGEELSTRFQQL